MKHRHGQETTEPVGPPSAPVKPLEDIAGGETVRLHSIHGGRQLRHRLAEMGLTPGTEMEIIRKGGPGPFIVRIKESQLVLGHGMLGRIFVSPDNDAE
ncbi:MAG: ferrous iron transport protein A [Phycisphaerae bacterium]